MSVRNPRQWSLIAAAISVAFMAMALTFGMSEWKDGDAATASAPHTTTVR